MSRRSSLLADSAARSNARDVLAVAPLQPPLITSVTTASLDPRGDNVFAPPRFTRPRLRSLARALLRKAGEDGGRCALFKCG
jgi:hypothetical protein